MRHRTLVPATLVALLLIAAAVHAVVTALLPMQDMLKDSQYIVVARVDMVYPEKPAMMLLISEDLKGKADFRKLPVNLKGDTEAAKDDHTAKLLKRVAVDVPIVLFVRHEKEKKLHTVFAYTNGTWFHMQKTGDDTQAWSFTHCEPYLRRTFKGSTAEMIKVVRDSLSGKRIPPGVKKDEPPGLGPELK